MVTEDAATSTPARRSRRNSGTKAADITVTTNKVVAGHGIKLESDDDNGTLLTFEQGKFSDDKDILVPLAGDAGKNLIAVLKKFFGGRGTGSPRKSKS
jgi:hypothetical protein